MQQQKFILYSLITLLLLGGCRKSDITINEAEIIGDLGDGTGTVTWVKGKTYILDGLVFVNPGQTLRIEAGTIIKAKPGQATNASALVVARGAKIIAEGTPEEPIIFTVEGDDLSGSVPYEARGLWGGVILLGNAPVNTASGFSKVEGIPSEESRGVYGGNNPQDDSGVLAYVSIRHGGTNIGEGNEINGLTLAGIGNKTEIHHIEVISNEDDGFEFFGGTVNASHLLAAFCGDDAFDFDQGYNGKLQFIAGIQSPYLGDNLAEHNGGSEEDHYGLPYTAPTIANATFIGNNYAEQDFLMKFTLNGAGTYTNSIFVQQKRGIQIEVTEEPAHSFNQFEQGRLALHNNLFYEIANNTTNEIFSVLNRTGEPSSAYETVLNEQFSLADNQLKETGIGYLEGTYNLVPGNIDFGALYNNEEAFFETVNFKGAFAPQEVAWVEPWSQLAREELIP
jgi:hypothetical protein